MDCPVVDEAEKAEEGEGEGEGGGGGLKGERRKVSRSGIRTKRVEVFYLTEIRGIGVEKRWSPLTVVAAWDVDMYKRLYMGDIREAKKLRELPHSRTLQIQ